MGLIIAAIVLAIIFGQKRDRRKSDVAKLIGPIAALIGVITILMHPFIVLAIVALVTFLIVMGIIKLTSSGPKWDQEAWEKKVSEQKKNVNPYSKTDNTIKNRQTNQGNSTTQAASNGGRGTVGQNSMGSQGQTNSHTTSYHQPQQPKPMKGDKLPKAPAKRKKIVQNFNTKYNLNLTEEQIQSISNSSYMSEIWHGEVEAMNQKYNSVYEWFPGYTQWLRTYMYVFHVQEITSDIKQQEQIVIKSFEELFAYADSLEGFSVSEKIEKINSKYMTSFDDATFMIAYRFLEAKGLHHTLEGPELLKEENELDELLEKYKTMPSGE